LSTSPSRSWWTATTTATAAEAAAGTTPSSTSGISSEADYPYTATNGTCQAAGKPRVDLPVRGFETLPGYNEFALLTAVGYGPVAVTICVGNNNHNFQYYEDGDGIYDGPCTRESRHSLLLVGYTSDYYILKNSYGEDWGYKGYMYLKRGNNRDGTCDILRAGGSYPNIELA
jgi:C1A family cysteine protease